MDDMIKQMMANVKPEDMLITEKNIQQKRVEFKGMINMVLEREKATIEEAVSKVDTTCLKVKVQDGTKINVYMIRPKALKNTKATAFVYARGGGAVAYEAEDFNSVFAMDALN